MLTFDRSKYVFVEHVFVVYSFISFKCADCVFVGVFEVRESFTVNILRADVQMLFL